MTARLALKVAGFCQQQMLLTRQERVVVGVSGGPDSLCLLHLLHHFKTELDLDLVVAHLNHQLRGAESQADEEFVKEIASAWTLPVWVDTQPVATLAAERKQSIEEAARQVRYAFLWRVANEEGAGKIAVGHNADDQVETILMHFLRGTGLAGLRGMLPAVDIATLRLHPDDLPAATSTPSPKIIRPLLELSRTEIEAYCRDHGLTPRYDTSNKNTTFFRNRLRHELIPCLETYNPNIRQIIQNMGRVVTADVDLLNHQLDELWPLLAKKQTPDRIELDLEGWLNLPLALKRSTLRRAVHLLRHGLRDINFEHIENAVSIVERGVTGSKATLPQELILTISYHRLIIAGKDDPIKLPPDIPHLTSDQEIPLKIPGVTPLPNTNWRLRTKIVLADAIPRPRLHQTKRWEAYLDAEVVGSAPVLRPRRSGDIFYPLGLGGHSKKVNEFMIDEKIPVEWRNHIPLLTARNQIMWICGYRLDERAKIHPTTEKIIHLKFELI